MWPKYFTEQQQIDISIMMSLKTEEEIRQWIEVVGNDDVDYGINLLKTAALYAHEEEEEIPAEIVTMYNQLLAPFIGGEK
jgi:hypothetical protein